MKVLIFGLPGSGKTTLAKSFADLIGGVHINADAVRTTYDDWDFTLEGRMRQAHRMRYLSDGVVMAGKIAVTDFVCPTKEARNAFAARHNCKDKKDRTKAGYWSCNLPRYAPALGLGAKMNTFW